ncbi:peptidase inhibitor 16 [Podarcis lilfordi]|uniref:Peptidase inhibitor 16 n=3 Tax=Podarcis lilfordi TaxID=74358 RepID=A0AA35PAF0_9SAUR|nr:peptidase inhibitor 16 [Podarcis lilfordi]
MLSSGLQIPPLFLLLLLLLLTAMELGCSFTEEDKKLLVDLHNQYRAKVSPPAADMLKMSWDPELEAFAKDYATKCIWEHNAERGRRGENLFAMSGDLDVTMAVDEWYNEYAFYNMTTLTCQEGQMCGHYTQVVWASSERVGCGTVFCETLEFLNDTDMHLVVCNYQPPGNIKGRKPYKEGAPCSMCPDGYSCKDSLCESGVDVGDATASPKPEPTAVLTASPALQTTPDSTPDTPDSPQTGAESESPTAEGPTSSLELTSDLSNSDATVSSLVTMGATTLRPASPESRTEKATSAEFPLSGGLATPEATIKKPEPPSTPPTPVHSTPKSPLVPKPASIPKPPSTGKPPSMPKPLSAHKHPFFSKLPVPKKPPVSKTPARHRLSAYSKAINKHSNAAQASADKVPVHNTAAKAASISVCLPCLGCKQISHHEEIKTALKELTSRYPYAPCFSPLPRWQRHSKWGNTLRKARPYWLNSL